MTNNRTNTRTETPKSVADLLGRFGRPQRTVPLYLDGEAVAEAAVLEQLWRRQVDLDEKTNEPDRAPDIARQVDVARERAEASRTEFVLRAIPHTRWAQLIGEHPPTQAQVDEAPVNARPEFNGDTFPGAAVRALLVSPDPGTDAEWAEFWGELSDGQAGTLWAAARILQMADGSLGKSVIASGGVLNYDAS